MLAAERLKGLGFRELHSPSRKSFSAKSVIGFRVTSSEYKGSDCSLTSVLHKSEYKGSDCSLASVLNKLGFGVKGLGV